MNDLVFVTTTNPGGLYAFAASSGECLWSGPGLLSIPYQPASLGVAIYGGNMVVAGFSNRLLVYQLGAGGCVRWGPLGGAAAGDPAIAQNTDGTLEVFVRGPDNALHHIRQTAPGDWFGLRGRRWPQASWPAILWLLVTRVANWKYSCATPTTRSTTSSRRRLTPGPIGSRLVVWTAGDPVVMQNADGTLEVFVRGPDNALHHIRQTAPM